jgi:hypothetical protein
MLVFGRVIAWSLCALLALLGTLASAQVISPGQWVGDLYLTEYSQYFNSKNYLIDDSNNIHLTIPNIIDAIDFPVPQDRRMMSLGSFWHDNAMYTVAYGKPVLCDNGMNKIDSYYRHWSFAKWCKNEWHFLCDYKTNPENYFTVIPCDKERFIVVASKRDLTETSDISKRTPFHRMSIISNKKELRLDSAIDHGIDEIRSHMSNPECFKLAFNGHVIMTDNYATLINFKTGLYWIFSLEKASLVRTGMIFKKVTPEMIAMGGFPGAILCANPEKNGTILISAQEESAFLTETGNALQEMQKLLNVPPVGAAYIREGTANDYWRPMPDGSVRMGLLDPLLIDDSKEQESKEQENKETAATGGERMDDAKPSDSDRQQAAAPEPPK